jgi:hypothetical protein
MTVSAVVTSGGVPVTGVDATLQFQKPQAKEWTAIASAPLGADGTVAGTLIHSAHVDNGAFNYQVRTPTGLIVTYFAVPGAPQWELFGNDIFVLSLNSDCSEPRYISPDVARSFPRGTSVVFHRDRWDWDFTIGTQRITPAYNARVYWLQGDGTCAPLGTIGDNGPALAELIRLEPTPVPIPVLTTPVTIG